MEMEPLAKYVHCAAHNLNLTLNDCVKNIAEMCRFYDTVEGVYTFFGYSIKRWSLLSGIISSELSEHGNVTLKRLCATRWSSRCDALAALRYRYADVMKALTKITLISEKREVRDEATALKKLMENFCFVFLIVQQTGKRECIVKDTGGKRCRHPKSSRFPRKHNSDPHTGQAHHSKSCGKMGSTERVHGNAQKKTEMPRR